ncbi:UNVERIFIED_CONTAM: hypothetical protein Sradi_3765600 [Sesamum radiatum]|uniref:Uncharacterized protein n=1 Tax=Sesamum radiatum TaxID=300843 RepID=A0AAW2PZK7_SESRA
MVASWLKIENYEVFDKPIHRVFNVLVSSQLRSSVCCLKSSGEEKPPWNVFEGVKRIPVAPEALMAEINSAITALEYARASVFLQSPPPISKTRNINQNLTSEYDARMADEAYKAGLASMAAGKLDEAVLSLNIASPSAHLTRLLLLLSLNLLFLLHLNISRCLLIDSRDANKFLDLAFVGKQSFSSGKLVVLLKSVQVSNLGKARCESVPRKAWKLVFASDAYKQHIKCGKTLPPNTSKKCKFLASVLKDAFAKCHSSQRNVSVSSPEAEEPASVFDEEEEKQELMITPKAVQRHGSCGDEREELFSAGSRLSRCSSATSFDAFVSVKTRFSRSSSLNRIDFQDFRRRSVILDLLHCEGWPFGLCRKALLLPPPLKSPSDSWS